jgi:hypothetical protein
LPDTRCELGWNAAAVAPPRTSGKDNFSDVTGAPAPVRKQASRVTLTKTVAWDDSRERQREWHRLLQSPEAVA